MLAVPFLTDVDPQAAVKGYRDPLGVQTIWSRLGRHVVGNLTTVTTSVRDFTTLILGYHFTERIADGEGGDGDLNVFLRWEQLAAHARFRVNGESGIRGIERVKKAKNEGDRIRLCADATGQILGNQRTYGLWGLYTGPARASGLVDGEPTRLTTAARRLVEDVYLPAFTASGLHHGNPLVKLLAKPKVDLDLTGKDGIVLEAVGKIIGPRLSGVEREVFRQHLLLGGVLNRTSGRQNAVATATEETLDDSDWVFSPARVRHLAKTCRRLGSEGEAAASRLERICIAEALLAPSAALFELLQGSDGQTIAEVAEAVKRAWGSRLTTIDPDALAELEPELRDSSGDADVGRRWVQTAQALSAGEYRRSLELLLEQNAFVMRIRAGAGAWIDVSGDHLRVLYRDANLGDLPERQQLVSLWRHSYFLDALRSIAVGLRS